MTTHEQRLIAYVDKELSDEQRALFEAEMAVDPALAQDVARHIALAERVSGAYASVLEEPIPPRLMAVATPANDRSRPDLHRLAPWAGIAASLVVGVAVGRMTLTQDTPLKARDGVLEARGEIAKALTRQLASERGGVRVGLSVRTADGRYCRTFESETDQLAGLACRERGLWRLRTVSAWTGAPRTAYRMAGSQTPPEVLAAVDSLGGQPLDAAAERSARDRGWR